MVYVVGASSLRNALHAAPYRLQKQLRSKTFAASGLSLNPLATPAKKLQNLLKGGSLSTKGDLVLWHDLINNTLSPHRSNGNKACPIEDLLHILARYKNKISAIVYTRRGGLPNVLKTLFRSKILVIDVEKYLLSPRKRKNPLFRKQLTRLHPSHQLELKLLLTVLRHQDNLKGLLKNRSNTRRPSQKRRRSAREKV